MKTLLLALISLTTVANATTYTTTHLDDIDIVSAPGYYGLGMNLGDGLYHYHDSTPATYNVYELEDITYVHGSNNYSAYSMDLGATTLYTDNDYQDED